ncbi:hypothetical protein C5167_018108 [Papaver somniferum]|uniref:Uncharacterized protein n=1 Tax=Papaver somniferum TaxID=3469 RepID=A0A4Y7ILC0_PAPSO|nr:hypothetical protein C5167_018108 [Papaver somniferum]
MGFHISLCRHQGIGIFWTLLLSIFLDAVTVFAYGTLFKCIPVKHMVAGNYGVALAAKKEGLVAEDARGLAWMDENIEKMEK